MTARPFLKWAGGKTNLLPVLRGYYPEGTFTYWEPFVGSGAVLFDVLERCRGAHAMVSDSNGELITTYRVVRDDVGALCARLAEHRDDHGPDHYYAVRSTDTATDVRCAARLIYLNRTCFNGLYRVNRAGRFNVPMGRYVNPKILDEENLRAVSRVLRRCVSIASTDFEVALTVAGYGDLVYLDPPYDPLPGKQSFTSYAGRFDWEDQERLARVVGELCTRGCRVVLSNSDTPRVRELYRDYWVSEVRSPRRINSKGDGRGEVSELVVSNMMPPEGSAESVDGDGDGLGVLRA